MKYEEYEKKVVSAMKGAGVTAGIFVTDFGIISFGGGASRSHLLEAARTELESERLVRIKTAELLLMSRNTTEKKRPGYLG